jgi:hypothetical protein
MVDIYIDDFIAVASRPYHHHTLQLLLWSASDVFQHDSHPDDSPVCKQTISASKIAIGDLSWSTQKLVLGWLIDTTAGTVVLPPHKVARLIELIDTYLPLHRTSRHRWQHLLGELHHMAMAI